VQKPEAAGRPWTRAGHSQNTYRLKAEVRSTNRSALVVVPHLLVLPTSLPLALRGSRSGPRGRTVTDPALQVLQVHDTTTPGPADTR
jgi:hypothetical protein